MSYNGSGTFVINTAGQPVVSGTVISSTAFNALTADLATGLSTAITKDGQTTPTANIPMGNNKITGLAVGTAATDAANLSQVQSTVAKLVNSVSGADTITGTMSPTLAAYATGQMFYFVAAGANTGAVTINIDSLGAKSITRDGTTALAAGDIQSGEVCVIVYDGTQFQLVNGASQSASIVTENLTVNKATVLNESGGDNDTRIEGDTDANLVFVDASTDRVGVGTSTPGSKLDIQTSSNTFVTVNSTSTTGYSGYTFKNSGTSGRSYSIAVGGSGTSSPFANNFYFYDDTAAAARMVLDASGNLGLGVTPSAWGSIFNAMQLGDGGFIAGRSDVATQLQLGCNGYYDGSNFKYIVTGTAARYYMDTGAHYWENAASGTAGNAITFTQAMTLDASGRLGINTTSPTRKLEVVDGSAQIRITDGTVNTYWEFRSIFANTNQDLFIENNNGVAINCKADREVIIFGTTDNGAYNLQCNGTGVWGAGAYVNGSDARLKDNIQSLDSGLDIVKAMRPVTFQYKPEHSKDQSVQPGFIAQELQQAMAGKPYLDGVVQQGTEYLNVAYQNIIPILVKAIQELEAKVAALEAK
jgi:hypothetical protein